MNNEGLPINEGEPIDPSEEESLSHEDDFDGEQGSEFSIEQSKIELSKISGESRAEKGPAAERRDIRNLFRELTPIRKLTPIEEYNGLAEKLKDKYQDLESDLIDLVRSKKENLVPHFYSEAITKVANYMVGTRSVIEDGFRSESEEDIDFEKTVIQGHKDAKKVFMNSCEHLYPSINAIPDVSLKVDLKGYARSLGNFEYFAGEGATLENLADLQDPSLSVMAKEDPKRLVGVLGRTIGSLSDSMGGFVEYNTIDVAQNNEGRIDFDDINLQKELGEMVKVLYGLELTLDQLQDRVYGPDKSIEEIAEIKQVELEIETSKSSEGSPEGFSKSNYEGEKGGATEEVQAEEVKTEEAPKEQESKKKAEMGDIIDIGGKKMYLKGYTQPEGDPRRASMYIELSKDELEKYEEGNENIIKEKWAKASEEAEKKRKQERAKKIEIPSYVEPGTKIMVEYRLGNAIFINEESQAKAQEKGEPLDKRREALIQKLKMQESMLNGLSWPISERIKKEATSKGEELTFEEVNKRSGNFSAKDTYNLIQEGHIDRFEKVKDGGEEYASLGLKKYPITDLLKAAEDLQGLLAEEATRAKHE